MFPFVQDSRVVRNGDYGRGLVRAGRTIWIGGGGVFSISWLTALPRSRRDLWLNAL